MPCNAGPDNNELLKTFQDQVLFLSRCLCATLTYIENNDKIKDFREKTDWTEAGIDKKELSNWWTNHKQGDEIRRRQERLKEIKLAEKLAKQKAKQEIINSMDPEIRKLFE